MLIVLVAECSRREDRHTIKRDVGEIIKAGVLAGRSRMVVLASPPSVVAAAVDLDGGEEPAALRQCDGVCVCGGVLLQALQNPAV